MDDHPLHTTTAANASTEHDAPSKVRSYTFSITVPKSHPAVEKKQPAVAVAEAYYANDSKDPTVFPLIDHEHKDQGNDLVTFSALICIEKVYVVSSAICYINGESVDGMAFEPNSLDADDQECASAAQQEDSSVSNAGGPVGAVKSPDQLESAGSSCVDLTLSDIQNVASQSADPIAATENANETPAMQAASEAVADQSLPVTGDNTVDATITDDKEPAAAEEERVANSTNSPAIADQPAESSTCEDSAASKARDEPVSENALAPTSADLDLTKDKKSAAVEELVAEISPTEHTATVSATGESIEPAADKELADPVSEEKAVAGPAEEDPTAPTNTDKEDTSVSEEQAVLAGSNKTAATSTTEDLVENSADGFAVADIATVEPNSAPVADKELISSNAAVEELAATPVTEEPAVVEPINKPGVIPEATGADSSAPVAEAEATDIPAIVEQNKTDESAEDVNAAISDPVSGEPMTATEDTSSVPPVAEKSATDLLAVEKSSTSALAPATSEIDISAHTAEVSGTSAHSESTAEDRSASASIADKPIAADEPAGSTAIIELVTEADVAEHDIAAEEPTDSAATKPVKKAIEEPVPVTAEPNIAEAPDAAQGEQVITEDAIETPVVAKSPIQESAHIDEPAAKDTLKPGVVDEQAASAPIVEESVADEPVVGKEPTASNTDRDVSVEANNVSAASDAKENATIESGEKPVVEVASVVEPIQETAYTEPADDESTEKLVIDKVPAVVEVDAPVSEEQTAERAIEEPGVGTDSSDAASQEQATVESTEELVTEASPTEPAQEPVYTASATEESSLALESASNEPAIAEPTVKESLEESVAEEAPGAIEADTAITKEYVAEERFEEPATAEEISAAEEPASTETAAKESTDEPVAEEAPAVIEMNASVTKTQASEEFTEEPVSAGTAVGEDTSVPALEEQAVVESAINEPISTEIATKRSLEEPVAEEAPEAIEADAPITKEYVTEERFEEPATAEEISTAEEPAAGEAPAVIEADVPVTEAQAAEERAKEPVIAEEVPAAKKLVKEPVSVEPAVEADTPVFVSEEQAAADHAASEPTSTGTAVKESLEEPASEEAPAVIEADALVAKTPAVEERAEETTTTEEVAGDVERVEESASIEATVEADTPEFVLGEQAVTEHAGNDYTVKEPTKESDVEDSLVVEGAHAPGSEEHVVVDPVAKDTVPKTAAEIATTIDAPAATIEEAPVDIPSAAEPEPLQAPEEAAIAAVKEPVGEASADNAPSAEDALALVSDKLVSAEPADKDVVPEPAVEIATTIDDAPAATTEEVPVDTLSAGEPESSQTPEEAVIAVTEEPAARELASNEPAVEISADNTLSTDNALSAEDTFASTFGNAASTTDTVTSADVTDEPITTAEAASVSTPATEDNIKKVADSAEEPLTFAAEEQGVEPAAEKQADGSEVIENDVVADQSVDTVTEVPAFTQAAVKEHEVPTPAVAKSGAEESFASTFDPICEKAEESTLPADIEVLPVSDTAKSLSVESTTKDLATPETLENANSSALAPPADDAVVAAVELAMGKSSVDDITIPDAVPQGVAIATVPVIIPNESETTDKQQPANIPDRTDGGVTQDVPATVDRLLIEDPTAEGVLDLDPQLSEKVSIEEAAIDSKDIAEPDFKATDSEDAADVADSVSAPEDPLVITESSALVSAVDKADLKEQNVEEPIAVERSVYVPLAAEDSVAEEPVDVSIAGKHAAEESINVEGGVAAEKTPAETALNEPIASELESASEVTHATASEEHAVKEPAVKDTSSVKADVVPSAAELAVSGEGVALNKPVNADSSVEQPKAAESVVKEPRSVEEADCRVEAENENAAATEPVASAPTEAEAEVFESDVTTPAEPTAAIAEASVTEPITESPISRAPALAVPAIFEHAATEPVDQKAENIGERSIGAEAVSSDVAPAGEAIAEETPAAAVEEAMPVETLQEPKAVSDSALVDAPTAEPIATETVADGPTAISEANDEQSSLNDTATKEQTAEEAPVIDRVVETASIAEPTAAEPAVAEQATEQPLADELASEKLAETNEEKAADIAPEEQVVAEEPVAAEPAENIAALKQASAEKPVTAELAEHTDAAEPLAEEIVETKPTNAVDVDEAVQKAADPAPALIAEGHVEPDETETDNAPVFVSDEGVNEQLAANSDDSESFIIVEDADKPSSPPELANIDPVVTESKSVKDVHGITEQTTETGKVDTDKFITESHVSEACKDSEKPVGNESVVSAADATTMAAEDVPATMIEPATEKLSPQVVASESDTSVTESIAAAMADDISETSRKGLVTEEAFADCSVEPTAAKPAEALEEPVLSSPQEYMDSEPVTAVEVPAEFVTDGSVPVVEQKGVDDSNVKKPSAAIEGEFASPIAEDFAAEEEPSMKTPSTEQVGVEDAPFIPVLEAPITAADALALNAAEDSSSSLEESSVIASEIKSMADAPIEGAIAVGTEPIIKEAVVDTSAITEEPAAASPATEEVSAVIDESIVSEESADRDVVADASAAETSAEESMKTPAVDLAVEEEPASAPVSEEHADIPVTEKNTVSDAAAEEPSEAPAEEQAVLEPAEKSVIAPTAEEKIALDTIEEVSDSVPVVEEQATNVPAPEEPITTVTDEADVPESASEESLATAAIQPDEETITAESAVEAPSASVPVSVPVSAVEEAVVSPDAANAQERAIGAAGGVDATPTLNANEHVAVGEDVGAAVLEGLPVLNADEEPTVDVSAVDNLKASTPTMEKSAVPVPVSEEQIIDAPAFIANETTNEQTEELPTVASTEQLASDEPVAVVPNAPISAAEDSAVSLEATEQQDTSADALNGADAADSVPEGLAIYASTTSNPVTSEENVSSVAAMEEPSASAFGAAVVESTAGADDIEGNIAVEASAGSATTEPAKESTEEPISSVDKQDVAEAVATGVPAVAQEGQVTAETAVEDRNTSESTAAEPDSVEKPTSVAKSTADDALVVSINENTAVPISAVDEEQAASAPIVEESVADEPVVGKEPTASNTDRDVSVEANNVSAASDAKENATIESGEKPVVEVASVVEPIQETAYTEPADDESTEKLVIDKVPAAVEVDAPVSEEQTAERAIEEPGVGTDSSDAASQEQATAESTEELVTEASPTEPAQEPVYTASATEESSLALESASNEPAIAEPTVKESLEESVAEEAPEAIEADAAITKEYVAEERFEEPATAEEISAAEGPASTETAAKESTDEPVAEEAPAVIEMNASVTKTQASEEFTEEPVSAGTAVGEDTSVPALEEQAVVESAINEPISTEIATKRSLEEPVAEEAPEAIEADAPITKEYVTEECFEEPATAEEISTAEEPAAGEAPAVIEADVPVTEAQAAEERAKEPVIAEEVPAAKKLVKEPVSVEPAVEADTPVFVSEEQAAADHAASEPTSTGTAVKESLEEPASEEAPAVIEADALVAKTPAVEECAEETTTTEEVTGDAERVEESASIEATVEADTPEFVLGEQAVTEHAGNDHTVKEPTKESDVEDSLVVEGAHAPGSEEHVVVDPVAKDTVPKTAAEIATTIDAPAATIEEAPVDIPSAAEPEPLQAPEEAAIAAVKEPVGEASADNAPSAEDALALVSDKLVSAEPADKDVVPEPAAEIATTIDDAPAATTEEVPVDTLSAGEPESSQTPEEAVIAVTEEPAARELASNEPAVEISADNTLSTDNALSAEDTFAPTSGDAASATDSSADVTNEPTTFVDESSISISVPEHATAGAVTPVEHKSISAVDEPVDATRTAKGLLIASANPDEAVLSSTEDTPADAQRDITPTALAQTQVKQTTADTASDSAIDSDELQKDSASAAAAKEQSADVNFKPVSKGDVASDVDEPAQRPYDEVDSVMYPTVSERNVPLRPGRLDVGEKSVTVSTEAAAVPEPIVTTPSYVMHYSESLFGDSASLNPGLITIEDLHAAQKAAAVVGVSAVNATTVSRKSRDSGFHGGDGGDISVSQRMKRFISGKRSDIPRGRASSEVDSRDVPTSPKSVVSGILADTREKITSQYRSSRGSHEGKRGSGAPSATIVGDDDDLKQTSHSIPGSFPSAQASGRHSESETAARMDAAASQDESPLSSENEGGKDKHRRHTILGVIKRIFR